MVPKHLRSGLLAAIAATAMLASTGLALAQTPQGPPLQLGGFNKINTTITLGGSSQAILFTFGATTKLWCIQNPSSATESLWVDFNEAAVVGGSEEIPAGTQLCMGGSVIFSSGYGGLNGTNSITINATTSAHAFQAFEWK